MAKNDIVLLDSVFNKSKPNYGSQYDNSEAFELFCFEQILKDFDPSQEELELGWVDGKDDGGIDGFFVFLDGAILTDSVTAKNVRKKPDLDIFIITCKHAATFEQAPINNLVASLPELFDLSKERHDLVSSFNEELLDIREIFCRVYKDLAIKQPTLNIKVFYVSRGEESMLAENIMRRTDYLNEILQNLFSNCNVFTDFIGASKLLALFRRSRSFSLRLKFIESYISRTQSNCIVLSKISDFYQFISDDEGKLRRYLFESNVRDYNGVTGVNQAISETLRSPLTASDLDFWWLNNGVTIIASLANIAGKEISLENIQIVNGLQTTETIYRHFSESGAKEDDRAVLIKVLVTKDEETRDKIIKATNSQTPVEIASLRATDKIQRDIEHILLDYGWYYERRKNLHRNQGRLQKQIISVSFMAATIKSLALKNPAEGSGQRTRFMRDDEQYNQVFNPRWDIAVFPSAIEFVKAVENIIFENSSEFRRSSGKQAVAQRLWIAFVLACRKIGTIHYTANMLTQLRVNDLTKEDVIQADKFLEDIRQENAAHKAYTRMKKSFLELVKQRLNSELGKDMPGKPNEQRDSLD